MTHALQLLETNSYNQVAKMTGISKSTLLRSKAFKICLGIFIYKGVKNMRKSRIDGYDGYKVKLKKVSTCCYRETIFFLARCHD
ncbi:hypothetical protein [Carnobacterium sp. 1290_CSPC]|uniref:hypothetical protein n=1 Tax=Carnobacterium sp. 1290_CSPC TaxID=1579347 RepID=UPI0009E55566|nr:hypothetical protein [Carnobacterium sp. 1290_CSPC]